LEVLICEKRGILSPLQRGGISVCLFREEGGAFTGKKERGNLTPGYLKYIFIQSPP
jgi:hypothetical protein